MKTLPKILLITSGLLFAISLTAPGGQVFYGLLKPLSALLFIAFFMTHLMSRFDAQQYADDQQLRNQLLHSPRVLEAMPLPYDNKAAA